MGVMSDLTPDTSQTPDRGDEAARADVRTVIDVTPVLAPDVTEHPDGFEASTGPTEAGTTETWFWAEQPVASVGSDVPVAAPTRRGRAVVAWFLAAALGAGAGSTTTFMALRDEPGAAGTRLVSPPITDQIDVPSNQAALVAKTVLPSIVQIGSSSNFGGQGTGSGVIYTDAGYIITNLHVVEGATRIIVGLPSGEEKQATLVGTGAAAGVDIAVLKVEATDLTPATFGSTRSISVGDLAVAVGSPFGLDATVTSGIISALHRNREDVDIRDAIQTDAPINPGNSGGALANARGEVIGINTAILSPGAGAFGSQGGNVGIGFAIPAEIVRNIADQIIDGKTPQLAYLGIEGSSLPGGKGARVSTVGPGTPAATAGLKAGDVIVKAGEESIGSMDELISFLISQKVGMQIALVVDRDGARTTLNVTLAARPTG